MPEDIPKVEYIEPDNVTITRFRNYFEFETPQRVNRTEEVTLFNCGAKASSLLFLVNEFKPHLRIFDSTGEELQFHGLPQKITGSEEDLRILNEKYGPYKVVIDFPQDKPIESNCFRTFTLKSQTEIPVSPGKVSGLEVSLGNAEHTYTYVKKLEQYEMRIVAIVQTDTDQRYSLGVNGEDTGSYEISGVKFEVSETETYYSIIARGRKEDWKISLLIEYVLHRENRLWFNTGICLASMTFFGNLLLLYWNPEQCLTMLTAVNGIIITYLLITKGWLFESNLDKTVGLNIFNRYFQYTRVYVIFIVLLFIEILIAILTGLSLGDLSRSFHILIEESYRVDIFI